MGTGSGLLDWMREWTYALGGPGSRERMEPLLAPRGEFGIDPYGFDGPFAVGAIAPLVWLYRKYFRTEVRGIENVPSSGRVLLVGNHSGQLPFDAVMIAVSMLLELDPPRVVRALTERWVATLPFISAYFARLGQVAGTPENCRRLLEAEEAMMVFPEGVRGLNKPWSKRYQLQEFGLGFMRLALECRTPIVPVAVVGAEEQAMHLANVKALAKLLAMPAFPLTPTLLPFPLPTRYRIWFGEPMRFAGSPDDDALVKESVAGVRATVQGLLDRGRRERQKIFR